MRFAEIGTDVASLLADPTASLRGLLVLGEYKGEEEREREREKFPFGTSPFLLFECGRQRRRPTTTATTAPQLGRPAGGAENGLRLDNIIFQLRGAQFAARPRAA